MNTRLSRLIALILVILCGNILLLSKTTPSTSALIGEAEGHKVLFISGYTNNLGGADGSAPVYAASDWSVIRNFLSTSPGDMGVEVAYLVEKLQLEGLLEPNSFLVFSYSGDYDPPNDYTSPKYKNEDTEPCPNRHLGRSCNEDDSNQWNNWADYINVILDEYDDAQFDFIGHSMGGAVAAYWAAREKANGDPHGRLTRVNSVITLDSPLNDGRISLCDTFGNRQLYSTSARDIIRRAPQAVPMFTIANLGDNVVPPSEAIRQDAWTRIQFDFGLDPSFTCGHQIVRESTETMRWIAQSMNAGEIVRPFTPPGYINHLIASAGSANDPLPRLQPDVEIIKPPYTKGQVPTLQTIIGQATTPNLFSFGFRQDTLRYSYPQLPPHQASGGLYDLQVLSANTHINTSSLMPQSIRYEDVTTSRAGIDFVIILDRSGSMNQPSPQKFQDVKDAAKLFVDLMGEEDRFGLVSFDDHAAPIAGFSSLQPVNPTTRGTAKSAIQGLVTGDTTSIGGGLSEAVNVLTRSTSDRERVFVLLTDGGENSSPCWQPAGTSSSDISPVEQQVLDSQAVVYSVALGQLSDPGGDCASGDPNARLLDIAATTGGEYTAAGSSEELIVEFNRIFDNAVGRQRVVDEQVDLPPGGTTTQTIQVLPNTSELAVSVSWTSNTALSGTLISPSGVVDPNSANVYYVVGLNYFVYNITFPEPGEWQVQISAPASRATNNGDNETIPVDIGISVLDSLRITTNFDSPSDSYTILEPIGLIVTLQDTSGPVTDAAVNATVTIPTVPAAALPLDDVELTEDFDIAEEVEQYLNAETQSVHLRLYDDGAHNDGRAKDGIFGAFFEDTVVSGSYLFDLAIHGTTPSGIAFERTARATTVVEEPEPNTNPPTDLSVMITKADTVPATPGATLNYCVTYANTGLATARTVGTYLLLPGDALVSSDTLGNRYEDLHYTDALWLNDDVPAGDYNSFKVQVRVPDGFTGGENFEVEAGVASGVSETQVFTSGLQLSPDRNISNDYAIANETPIASINMEANWNLISFPLDHGGIHPAGLLCNLNENYEVVLGYEDEALTFDPNLPGYFSTLRQMDGMHGYWVKANQAISIPVSGSRLDPETEYYLKEGWNLVSYLPTDAVPVEDALASIDGMYSIVLGFDGGGTSYYTGIPPELNSLNVMEPGKGYWIKMSEPGTLDYSQATTRVATTSSGVALINRPQNTSGVTPTNEWVNLYSTSSTYNGEPLPVHSWVDAIGEDGRLLGRTVVRSTGQFGVLSVYRDDGYTIEVDGARPGEQIRFLINGQPATIANGVTPTWTTNGDLMAVELAATGPVMQLLYLPGITMQ